MVPQPAGGNLDAPVLPSRWQEHEEFVAGMAGIREDLQALPPAALRGKKTLNVLGMGGKQQYQCITSIYRSRFVYMADFYSS